MSWLRALWRWLFHEPRPQVSQAWLRAHRLERSKTGTEGPAWRWPYMR